MRNPFRKRSSVSAPVVNPDRERYLVVLDAVKRHADRGTSAAVVQRAMIEWSPDSAPQIRAAVHEVYGCACPTGISGSGPHFDSYLEVQHA